MNTLYFSSELKIIEHRSLHRRDMQSKILGLNQRTAGHLEAAGSCYTCHLEGESRGTAYSSFRSCGKLSIRFR